MPPCGVPAGRAALIATPEGAGVALPARAGRGHGPTDEWEDPVVGSRDKKSRVARFRPAGEGAGQWRWRVDSTFPHHGATLGLGFFGIPHISGFQYQLGVIGGVVCGEIALFDCNGIPNELRTNLHSPHGDRAGLSFARVCAVSLAASSPSMEPVAATPLYLTTNHSHPRSVLNLIGESRPSTWGSPHYGPHLLRRGNDISSECCLGVYSTAGCLRHDVACAAKGRRHLRELLSAHEVK